jgi:hypothetical protein
MSVEGALMDAILAGLTEDETLEARAELLEAFFRTIPRRPRRGDNRMRAVASLLFHRMTPIRLFTFMREVQSESPPCELLRLDNWWYVRNFIWRTLAVLVLPVCASAIARRLSTVLLALSHQREHRERVDWFSGPAASAERLQDTL